MDSERVRGDDVRGAEASRQRTAGTTRSWRPLHDLTKLTSFVKISVVVSILRKKRQKVTDYRVEVRGQRREEHPRSYKRMEVHHIVTGRNISERSVAQAIELSEQKYCSVAATLRPTVEIVSSFEIIEG